MSVREYLVKLVARDLGSARDNLIRARHAFRGQDLDKEYGESGQTRRSILEGYEAAERAAMEAERYFQRGGGFDE